MTTPELLIVAWRWPMTVLPPHIANGLLVTTTWQAGLSIEKPNGIDAVPLTDHTAATAALKAAQERILELERQLSNAHAVHEVNQ